MRKAESLLFVFGKCGLGSVSQLQSFKSLNSYARLKDIPSMGAHKIKDWLINAARSVPAGARIVEVGSWLGAGAGYMAIAAPDREVHVYDRFRANCSEIQKALAAGIEIAGDTLPAVKKNLRGLDNIHFHKCDIKEMRWAGGPIGLYVDDASKLPSKWNHVSRQLLPSLIPGAIVILMDYYFFKKTKKAGHKCQYDFMTRHSDLFELIGATGGPEAMFRRNHCPFKLR